MPLVFKHHITKEKKKKPGKSLLFTFTLLCTPLAVAIRMLSTRLFHKYEINVISL